MSAIYECEGIDNKVVKLLANGGCSITDVVKRFEDQGATGLESVNASGRLQKLSARTWSLIFS